MLALLRKYTSSAARSSSSDFFSRKYVIPITRAETIIIADSVIITHLDTILIVYNILLTNQKQSVQ
ncbi:hypothetical protein MT325_m325L [Paramecium bursaria chlorella virus MT325]|uniref:Uncharacterized protein m325L n=1 Tax=Paramecium bursaria Chlorella virus MT325 TaxID=346932 RepID=A7IU55_PBCVM|nr:hypothetical protein MT325_m325L [Paramecium bursaria chlorella virus MT325]